MEPTQQRSTIFALSSGRGRAGVAVIRVSGPRAGDVLDLMAAPRPRPRVAALRKVRHPLTSELIDEGLVLLFPAPRSETGEDLAEFHVHGGAAVVAATLRAIGSLDQCRLAEPGEFARRSFENGKIDLTAAEGLADLIEAETEGQRRQALRQAGGALATLYDGWRLQLVEALALMETAIDFSDEADVATNAVQAARERAATLAAAISDHLADRRGEILRDGFRVVLAGPPNAGKSSLFNALVRRDVAIVSPEPGTTRDVIEVRLDLGGLPVVIADTAGLRDADGAVEREGIRRSWERSGEADLLIWLADGAAPDAPVAPPVGFVGTAVERLVVRTKSDLRTCDPAAGLDGVDLEVSARRGDGIGALLEAIARRAALRIGDLEAPVLTRERHREHLTRCLTALVQCAGGPAEETELRADDMRQAAFALGRLTGRIDVEDVLDQVFSRFCIGK